VADCLQGALSPLPPDALEFREANARREKDVAAAGDRAWTAYLEKNKAMILEALPPLNLIRDDRSALTGKRVVLTGMSWRQTVTDGDRAIITGQHSGHGCFIATDQEPLRKVQQAYARYRTKVNPRASEGFDVVGRLGAQTRMVVTRSGTVIGFDLEVTALRATGNFFIDASETDFAGEATLKIADLPAPSAETSPSDVMRTLVAALKGGNADVWKSLYADWTAVGGEGPPYYRPFNPYNTWDNDWNRARNTILNKVLHAEPLWESDPRTIMTGKEFEGAPRIEQVMVEMNHVNRFDDGDRVFTSVDVRRVWTLQRRDAGPWRIASRNTI
jgi:hypothetical protein